MIVYLLFFVIIVVGLLAMQFHRLASQARRMAFRFQIGEEARQIAAAAEEEAVALLWKKAENPGSSEFDFLLRHVRGVSIALELPLTARHAAGQGKTLSLTATATIVAFHDADFMGQPFYPGEGLGMLGVTVNVVLRRGRVVVASCQIIRHHDFRVVALLTAPPRQGCYTASRFCDFALFVRKGITEFEAGTPSRSSYNTRHLSRLVLGDQSGQAVDKRGKVFFGGTDLPTSSRDRPLFFNTSDTLSSYRNCFPAFTEGKIHEIPLEDLLELLPGLKPLKSKLTGLKGVFTARFGPIHRAEPAPGQEGNEEQAIRNALAEQATEFERNYEPGILRISSDDSRAADPAYARTIMEGAIRQRFTYIVRFALDVSGVSGLSAKEKAALNKDPSFQILCLPLTQAAAANPDAKAFCQALDKLDQRQPQPPFPLVSTLDDDFLLAAGDQPFRRRPRPVSDSFPAPAPFFARKGSQVTPLDHDFNLTFGPLRWRIIDYQDWFAKSSLYSPATNRLNLRGIVTVDDRVVLSGAGTGPLLFKGKGILVANEGFVIRAGIRRAPEARPDDFCILATRGKDILIDTSDEIEAFLLTIGGNGRVIPLKPLKLKGGMAVDRLDTHLWAAGDHSIVYDPVFRRTPVEGDLFQILPSPQISFQKISEEGS